MQASTVTLTALPGIPMVKPGDDVADILIQGLNEAGIMLRDKDVLVLAQKIISKAEGRYVNLEDVSPSDRAAQLAARIGKDPRLVEVILSESAEVVACREGGALIVEHRLGYVMANAGVDQSNISHSPGNERALLLPMDPDATCAHLRSRLKQTFDADVGVIINDSFGRPWRNGVVGVALGAAGLPSLQSLIGAPDLYGRAMRVTEIAVADEIAAAASLVMGQADEGKPVIHIRGLKWDAQECSAAALLRPKQRDMFR
jgi:coenzyme F420-0:L-glutamate ligase/coenzyme F420-1:gamma-L-glutamate ligase